MKVVGGAARGGGDALNFSTWEAEVKDGGLL